MRFVLFLVIAFAAGYAQADPYSRCISECKRNLGMIGSTGGNQEWASTCYGRCTRRYLGNTEPTRIGSKVSAGSEACLEWLGAALGGSLEIVDNEPYLRDNSPENQGKIVYRGFKKGYSIDGEKGCASHFEGASWMSQEIARYKTLLKSNSDLQSAIKASCNGVKESYVETLLQALDLRSSPSKSQSQPGAA